MQQGVVGGVVFNDANANGGQDSGEGGVSGRTVYLYIGSATTPVSTTTGANGSYAFDPQDLDTTYKVCIGAASGQTQTYPVEGTDREHGVWRHG